MAEVCCSLLDGFLATLLALLLGLLRIDILLLNTVDLFNHEGASNSIERLRMGTRLTSHGPRWQ